MSTVVGRFSRRQPTSAPSRRAVKNKAAKVFENPKSCLMLRGASTSQVVQDAMNDLSQMMKPFVKKLAKRNAFHPFEGQEHLEFLGFKNDCSLICFGSDSKKRPHNLTLARQHDFHVLDMMELGIIAADRLALGEAKGEATLALATKPVVVFEGSEWEADPFFTKMRNFLLDFFGGRQVTEISLPGVDRAMVFSLRSRDPNGAAVEAPSADYRGAASPIGERGNAVVCMRHYGVVQASSITAEMTKATNLKLVDVGPNFDFEVRRVSFATPHAMKKACRLPKEALAFMKHAHDNIQTDALGNLRGQLHVGQQDVGTLSLRRFAAHKRQKRDKRERGAAAPAAEGAAEITTGVAEAAPAARVSRSRSTGDSGELLARKRRRRGKADAGLTLGPDVDI